ncbi:MAG: hypothetical protein BRD29_03490 [Bacteroidetes bacterium QH_2_67_10]|nr:MAG: hypothetical protein BRD29_03490 [Bacteroidetes bacterium QH_2_67_10]
MNTYPRQLSSLPLPELPHSLQRLAVGVCVAQERSGAPGLHVMPEGGANLGALVGGAGQDRFAQLLFEGARVLGEGRFFFFVQGRAQGVDLVGDRVVVAVAQLGGQGVGGALRVGFVIDVLGVEPLLKGSQRLVGGRERGVDRRMLGGVLVGEEEKGRAALERFLQRRRWRRGHAHVRRDAVAALDAAALVGGEGRVGLPCAREAVGARVVDGLDGAPAGGEVLRGRHLERGVVRQLAHRLHQPLAVGRPADDEAAVVVLHRAGSILPRVSWCVGACAAVAIVATTQLVTTQPWYDRTLFQIVLGTLLAVVGARMAWSGSSDAVGEASPNENAAPASGGPPYSWPLLAGVGTGAGIISPAAGVGGGVVLVPAYHRLLRLPINRASGTSSGTIVLISLVGVVSYAVSGWGASGLPGAAVGYVDVVRAALLAGPSILGARGGVWAAHRVPDRLLRWGFATYALVVAGSMFYDVWAG